MKYKRSIYNIVIDEFQNGDLLLFNSSSCGFGIMKSKYINLYNCIEELNMDILSSEDELFISAMTNNGFLVEYDLDEFAALEVDEKIARYSSHAGKTLTIAPTLGCNMNCPYCFENHKNRKGMNQETKLKLVKFVEKFLDDAKAFRVIWFGGEPLIEFETIRELSKEFIKICNSRNISYEPSIVTNGILLDYEKAKILTEECKINHAQITIDGLEETHNKRRRLINNKDSFKVIVNNIESIKELLDISIRVNIDKNNEDQMEKLIDYFILEKKWGKDDRIRFYFGPIEKSTDECNISNEKCFNPIEFADLLKKSYKKLYDYGYYEAFDKLFIGNKIVHCGAVTRSSFVIDAEGDIYTCWNTLGMEEYRIGNIDSPVEVNSRWLPWLNLEKPEECKKCDILPLCKGECAFKRLKNGNKISCSHHKDSYKDVLKNIYKCNKEDNYEKAISS